jgi:hypothetical protein
VFHRSCLIGRCLIARCLIGRCLIGRCLIGRDRSVSHRRCLISRGLDRSVSRSYRSVCGVSSVGVSIGRCRIGRCLIGRLIVGLCLIGSCHRFVSIVFYLTVSHVSVCLRDRCVSSPVWVCLIALIGLSHLIVSLSLIGYLLALVSCIGDLLSSPSEVDTKLDDYSLLPVPGC